MASNFVSKKISYQDTHRFTHIVLDYLDKNQDLRPFYRYDTTVDDVLAAVKNKQKHPVNRQLLVGELNRQYEGVSKSEAVSQNIRKLESENTFTICTAHQPNLFTGHFYFIHKIIHVIRMADDLNKTLTDYHFVPVFFMGSEDADIEELNHLQFEDKRFEWQTLQTGAVGKMYVDDALLKLIPQIEGRLLAEPFGNEVCALLKQSFKKGTTIQQATFLFVHGLFERFGLIVFLPDSAAFKREMIAIFEDDIFNNTPAGIVTKTSAAISDKYRAQAFARDINLFYMKDDIRNRIIKTNDAFAVHNTDISFTADELKEELRSHPERFSPNVILRGLFQEYFLPDVAFIGGGGELAYWLQLKGLFDHYDVPYPILFLRNSFLIIEKHWNDLRKTLSVGIPDLFDSEEDLLQRLVKRDASTDLSLTGEKATVEKVFSQISERAKSIDVTLVDHIASLRSESIKKLDRVEQKFIAAEKKKQASTTRQLHKLLNTLFPGSGLQERTDNFMLLYSKWGPALFDEIYKTSPVFSPGFTIISEE